VRKTNYFVEGLQGAGKSTFVRLLSEQLKDYQVFHEGDYSPVELAWCAWATKGQYARVLKEYSLLAEEIRKKTAVEGNCRIIRYTQILAEIPDFYKDMKYITEIWTGNLLNT
jgi:hypothetical protein